MVEKGTFLESLLEPTDVTAKCPEVEPLIEERFIIEVQATVQGVKNQLD